MAIIVANFLVLCLINYSTSIVEAVGASTPLTAEGMRQILGGNVDVVQELLVFF
jgi:hypothetical protein